MSKAKFTEADVKRAVKGVIGGGGSVACEAVALPLSYTRARSINYHAGEAA
jgi:hypothetical protein